MDFKSWLQGKDQIEPDEFSGRLQMRLIRKCVDLNRRMILLPSLPQQQHSWFPHARHHHSQIRTSPLPTSLQDAAPHAPLTLSTQRNHHLCSLPLLEEAQAEFLLRRGSERWAKRVSRASRRILFFFPVRAFRASRWISLRWKLERTEQ